MLKKIGIVLLVLSVTLALTGQVVINEYSASNLNSFLDDFGRTEDWIELYNTSDQDIDLSGYHISDKQDKPEKWTIPTGITIPGNGYLLFWCSGRDLANENGIHTNFKLTQTEGKDQIVFADPSGVIIESTEMELTLTEHSRCKSLDGGSSWMVCTEPTPGDSNNESPKYNGYTLAPSTLTTAGFYTDSVMIELVNNTPGSILRYTTNGHNPTESSTEYTGPFLLSQTSVVKAQSFPIDDTLLTGKMDFNTYFINENDFTVAVFSVAADEVINLANGNGDLIPIGSLEYWPAGATERETKAYGSLNRHGQDSWILNHRSLDWVTRDEMGYTKAVNAELFNYSDRNAYQKFMFRNSGDDNYPAINDQAHQGSTHIRDEYVQTLAQEGDMALDLRAVERVVLFLNGEYWGLYGMRERPVDHDYTNEYYDQGKYEIQYLSTWGSTEVQYGGTQALEDWTILRDFVLENDMSIDSNYTKVKSELNTKSLIDYMLMNLNVVAIDWLNYNTGWWRGLNPDGDHKKWGYILWDLDATFDYYINYTGVPNQNFNALPCDINDISESMDEFWQTDGGGGGLDSIDYETCPTIISGECPYPPNDSIFIQVVNNDEFCCFSSWDNICQDEYDNILLNGGSNGGGFGLDGNFGKHEKIFIKLIEESSEFRQQYYSRQADLMNTVFSCENMTQTLDKMLAVIEPEMPRQIERWGGTISEWESNVQDLKDFIEARCNFLGQGMTDCYNITGPFDLTIVTEPEGVGDDVNINSLKIEEFPWSGAYFGNMENIIEADKKDGEYEFSHWESRNGSVISPSPLEREARIMISSPDTLVAVYKLSTATEEITLDKSIDIYPNPTRSEVNIEINLDESAEISIDLYSSTGVLLSKIQEKTHMARGDKITIDFKDLNVQTGVYMVKMNINNSVVSKRVTFIE